MPLGLAMTEVIAETTLPVIAHHHDFAWERERFTLNAVNDYLQAAFPPLLYAMEHVVINSMAQKELARRLGIPSQIIPNVLDFETPAPAYPIEALASLKQPCAVTIYTDSQYLRNGISSWIHAWKARGWRSCASPTATPSSFRCSP